MNPLEFQLKQAVKLFKAASIDYAILGGVAVSLYGEPRLTFDIDINIMLDKNKLGDFLKVARKYGFMPLPANIKKFVRDTGVIPVKFSKNKAKGRCDFIVAQNILETLCIKRARLRKVYSVKARIVTAEDLIIHKITSRRPKDLEDAHGVLIRQRGKLDTRYITHWLKRIEEAASQPGLVELFKSYEVHL